MLPFIATSNSYVLSSSSSSSATTTTTTVTSVTTSTSCSHRPRGFLPYTHPASIMIRRRKLHWAIRHGLIHEMERHLRNNTSTGHGRGRGVVDPNEPLRIPSKEYDKPKYTTLLHYVVQQQQGNNIHKETMLAMIQLLLQAGADPSIHNHEQATVLDVACHHGLADVVTVILRHQHHHYQNDLVVAGKRQPSKRLLHPNSMDQYGESCLHIACRLGYTQVVKVLLELGANPMMESTLDRIPLITACKQGHLDIVRLLVDAMTTTTGSTDRNTTTATTTTTTTKCRMMISSALHCASYHGHVPIVQYLLEHITDIEINATDSIGETALHKASVQGHGMIVLLLMEHGANVYQMSHHGKKTAIDYACRRHHGTIVRILFQHGCTSADAPSSSHWSSVGGGYGSC